MSIVSALLTFFIDKTYETQYDTCKARASSALLAGNSRGSSGRGSSTSDAKEAEPQVGLSSVLGFRFA